MIQVDTPDGGVAEFPDGTSPDVMRSALRKKFGGGPAKGVSKEIRSFSTAPTTDFRTGDPLIDIGIRFGSSELAQEAVKNIPGSAVEFGKNLVQPFIHPVETAINLGNIGKGVLQKLGIMSGDDATPYADAVGKFLMDRYGSGEAIKRTIATDPVGIAADVSMVLSGGGTAAARAPGVVGRIGELATTVGRTIDPLTAVGATVKAGGAVASEGLGLTTGTGGEAIRTAARAGAEGGEAGRAFRENMRGQAPIEEVVTDARAAVAKLKTERGDIYRKEMAKLGADKTVLDFADIDRAVDNTVQKFKGVSTSLATEKIQKSIRTEVELWKLRDPAEFHTAEGFDALKQIIGDIRDKTQYGTPERLAADKVYQAIRKTITDQVPEYGRIMKGYEEATAAIKEIEQTLSVNPKARIDTALRKITSALRDNVNTNYGRRKELVAFLARSGATHLLEKIAGQSLKSATPRGLSGISAITEGAGAATALAAGHPAVATTLAGLAAVSSPRLVGEAAHLAGRVSRLPLRALGRSAFQLGRLPQSQ